MNDCYTDTNYPLGGPTPVRVRCEDLGPQHVGGRFRIVEHRWSKTGCMNTGEGTNATGVLDDWHDSGSIQERRIADPTSVSGYRYFGPGSVLEWLAPRSMPRVGATVRLTKQFTRDRERMTSREGKLGLVLAAGARAFTVQVDAEQWAVWPEFGDEWIEIPTKPPAVPPPPALSDYFIPPDEVAAIRRERDELAAQVRSLTSSLEHANSERSHALSRAGRLSRENDQLRAVLRNHDVYVK